MDPSIYRLRHRDILTLCVLALLCLGVVMVQSAAMNVTGKTNWQWTAKGVKHLVFAIVSAITFFAVGNFDYDHLARRRKRVWLHPIIWMFLCAMFTCALVLVPHIGMEVNGARRWLPLGPVQVQPSELAKWGTVLLMAWWMTHRPVKLENFFTGFVPTLVPVVAICLLVVAQD